MRPGLGRIVASHQCRAVGLPCQSVDEVPHGFREVLCVILGADPVHAVRSMFVDGGPALVQPGRSEPLGEVTKPLLLLAAVGAMPRHEVCLDVSDPPCPVTVATDCGGGAAAAAGAAPSGGSPCACTPSCGGRYSRWSSGAARRCARTPERRICLLACTGLTPGGYTHAWGSHRDGCFTGNGVGHGVPLYEQPSGVRPRHMVDPPGQSDSPWMAHHAASTSGRHHRAWCRRHGGTAQRPQDRSQRLLPGAVRSTKKHVMRCVGLKWVAMMLRVPVPWRWRPAGNMLSSSSRAPLCGAPPGCPLLPSALCWWLIQRGNRAWRMFSVRTCRPRQRKSCRGGDARSAVEVTVEEVRAPLGFET